MVPVAAPLSVEVSRGQDVFVVPLLGVCPLSFPPGSVFLHVVSYTKPCDHLLKSDCSASAQPLGTESRVAPRVLGYRDLLQSRLQILLVPK